MKGLFYALDILLPRTCLVCGDRLHTAEKDICLHCLADMPLTYYWTMTRNPMADRLNQNIQEGLKDYASETYAYAAALFFYSEDNLYCNIPKSIKYQGNTSAGMRFAAMLGQRLASADHFRDADIIIPVPLHWKRKWERGYNQAEIIAKGVSSVMNVPVRTDILARCRRTETQTRLQLDEKAANVSGAFHAKAAASDSTVRHILLIDDVFTTGSTLMACFTALRSAFPPGVRISVATLGFVGGG